MVVLKQPQRIVALEKQSQRENSCKWTVYKFSDQGQAPWPQRLSQYQLLEVLSWREKPFFQLVVSDQILHLLAQCWFNSSLHRGCKWLSVQNPHCLLCNFHNWHEQSGHTMNTCKRLMTHSHKSFIVVVISLNSHDTTFASWHIFTCHNALWLFKKQPQRESSHCGCFSNVTTHCGRFKTVTTWHFAL